MRMGCLILALRLLTLLDTSAASPLPRRLRRCPDSVCDKLTSQGTARMQPFVLPVYPRSWARLSSARPVYPLSLLVEAVHWQAVEPAILTPAALASLPTVPERQLPAALEVGPLSSESTLPTPRRSLTPAQTVRVCLLHPTSRASAHLS